MNTLPHQRSNDSTGRQWSTSAVVCSIVLFFAMVTMVSRASAQEVLFDFDNAPRYSSLPIDQTVGGITAHFSATGQGFSIQDANVLGFTPQGFAGRCIYPNSIYLADLLIRFDQPITDFSIMYSCQELGCDDAATMRVTGFKNGTQVLTTTMTARNPGTWPTDTLKCSYAQGFDSVVVHYDKRPPTCQDYGVIFMADNMRVIPLATPAFTISSSAGSHGSIWPAPGIQVNSGSDQHFSILPEIGYHVDSLLVDDVQVPADTQYTFTAVSAPHSIRVTFAINTYVLSAASGPHGMISPSGDNVVAYNDSLRFDIVPDAGYHLDTLLIDGVVNADSTSSYTFKNVAADHSMYGQFIANQFTITASAGPYGTINPAGSIPAVPGGEQVVTFIPDQDCRVDSVIVDGVVVPDSLFRYTFKNISANHEIRVTFSLDVYAASSVVHERWNILSLPLGVIDSSASVLFSTAISPAYAYEGSYVGHPVLQRGKGYWLKFPAPDTITISGARFLRLDIPVVAGWNLIGGLSIPVPTKVLAASPADMVLSEVFGYQNGYTVVGTMEPAKGYWLKVNKSGVVTIIAPGMTGTKTHAR